MAYPKYSSMEVVGGGYRVGVIHTLTSTEFLRPGLSLLVVIPPGAPDLPWGLGFKLGLASSGLVVRMVGRPRDLMGAVCLSSPELALRYARLFTSPATVELLRGQWWFEVVPESAVNESFYFGREDRPWPIRPEAHLKMLAEESPADRERQERQFRKWFPTDQDVSTDTWRYYGVLYHHEWQEEGLPGPEVEQKAEGFVVRRVLFQARPSERTRKAWLVSESIRRDGLLRRHRVRELQLGERLVLAVPAFV